jgi:hypothetical protein
MSPLLTGTSVSSTSTLLSTPRVWSHLPAEAFPFFRDEPLRICWRPSNGHRRRRVRAEGRPQAILVMGPFKAGIGFGAIQSFEFQTTPPSRRETLQTGTEFACEFFRAPIAVRQLFL